MQKEITTPFEVSPELKAIAKQRWGTLEQRFWRKVIKLEGEDSCWVWIGAHNEHGYGSFFFRNRLEKAHRASWVINCGDFPYMFDVLHKCDNPRCVRPSHLFLGNAKSNGKDAAYKHRTKQGERHWNSKLTSEIVGELRKAFVPRKNGMVDALAKKYGLNRATVKQVVYNMSWKHLPLARRSSRIDQEVAAKIVHLRSTGVSTIEIAKVFHVSNTTIKNVLNKKYQSYGLAP